MRKHMLIVSLIVTAVLLLFVLTQQFSLLAISTATTPEHDTYLPLIEKPEPTPTATAVPTQIPTPGPTPIYPVAPWIEESTITISSYQYD